MSKFRIMAPKKKNWDHSRRLVFGCLFFLMLPCSLVISGLTPIPDSQVMDAGTYKDFCCQKWHIGVVSSHELLLCVLLKLNLLIVNCYNLLIILTISLFFVFFPFCLLSFTNHCYHLSFFRV